MSKRKYSLERPRCDIGTKEQIQEPTYWGGLMNEVVVRPNQEPVVVSHNVSKAYAQEDAAREAAMKQAGDITRNIHSATNKAAPILGNILLGAQTAPLTIGLEAINQVNPTAGAIAGLLSLTPTAVKGIASAGKFGLSAAKNLYRNFKKVEGIVQPGMKLFNSPLTGNWIKIGNREYRLSPNSLGANGAILESRELSPWIKELPLDENRYYRSFGRHALKSYKDTGVITQYDTNGNLRGDFEVPMFSKGKPTEHRLSINDYNKVWAISKPESKLEWEKSLHDYVTPKVNGEFNKAPISDFDFYVYNPEKGYIKLDRNLNLPGGIPVSETPHVDYLKGLSTEEQIKYLTENGLNDQWLWTLENKPDHLESALRGASIPTTPKIAPKITAENAVSITPEVTHFYHGSPVRFDAFSADFIGSGEGGSKVMRGINLWPVEKIANAPKLANIKSPDAPLHLGVSSTPLGGKLNPTVYDVSGKGLKLYKAAPRDIKSLKQEDLIKQGYDGVQTSNQVTIFPESIGKLSIDKQSSIEDFVMSHPEVERWTPWTTDNQKMQNIIDMSKMSKWTPAQWTAAQDAAVAKALNKTFKKFGGKISLETIR